MTVEEIRDHLARDGWPIEEIAEGILRSKFRGKSRTFPFFVHVEAGYLTLAVIPFARLPGDRARARELQVKLLHLNREINLAKFSVDDDGDVVLSVEYPVAELDPSELRDAVDVLSFYAETHWAQVNEAAGEGAETADG